MFIYIALGDALHLIDLGITKRFLVGWKNGTMNNNNARWSASEIKAISQFLVKTKLPKELNKRPLRGLDDLAFWKGSEYRSFLLYASIVVVKEFFKEHAEIFNHFLHFFCAIVICIRPNQSRPTYEIAKKLLNHFLNGVKLLYGNTMFSSNMHSVSHLVDDVIHLGPLETFHAYPFESKLFDLKRLIRTGNLPLQQVARRICEIHQNLANSTNLSTESSSTENKPICKKEYSNQSQFPLILKRFLQKNRTCEVYSYVEFDDFCLNTDRDPDKWILAHNKVIIIDYIIKNRSDSSIYLCGRPLAYLHNYFDEPLKSSFLSIFYSNMETLDPIIISKNAIENKMVKVQCYEENGAVFLPLMSYCN